ncbi:uncharacterized protein LOC115226571 [Argonauta hians]
MGDQPPFHWKNKPTWYTTDHTTLSLTHTPSMEGHSIEIALSHILCARTEPRHKSNQTLWSVKLHYIKKGRGKMSLQPVSLELQGLKEVCQSACSHINGLVHSLPARMKRLLVIVNPNSGRKKALKVYKQLQPLFDLANITTEVVETQAKKHAMEMMLSKNLDEFDGVVVVGGDGTYCEVLNGLLMRTQKDAHYDLDSPGTEWKPCALPVGIIPCGTGNGVADYLVSKDAVTATLAVVIGRQCEMKTYSVHNRNGKFLTFGGLLFGYGFGSDVIYKAENRRDLGIFRYPIYMLWGICHIRRFEVELQYEEGASTERAPPTGTNEGGATTEHREEDMGGATAVTMATGGGAKAEHSGEGGATALTMQIRKGWKAWKDTYICVAAFINNSTPMTPDPNRDLNDPNRDLNDPDHDLNDPDHDLNDPDHDLNDVNRDLNDASRDPQHDASRDPQHDASRDPQHDPSRDPQHDASRDQQSKSCETTIYMCKAVNEMFKMFKSLISGDYTGPMIKTRRLVLNLPSANMNNEMEMALNCDGDYIILESPISIEICFQVGLIRAFCC